MDNENKTTINRSYQANVEYERLKAAKTGIAKGILHIFNSNSIKYAPMKVLQYLYTGQLVDGLYLAGAANLWDIELIGDKKNTPFHFEVAIYLKQNRNTKISFFLVPDGQNEYGYTKFKLVDSGEYVTICNKYKANHNDKIPEYFKYRMALTACNDFVEETKKVIRDAKATKDWAIYSKMINDFINDHQSFMMFTNQNFSNKANSVFLLDSFLKTNFESTIDRFIQLGDCDTDKENMFKSYIIRLVKFSFDQESLYMVRHLLLKQLEEEGIEVVVANIQVDDKVDLGSIDYVFNTINNGTKTYESIIKESFKDITIPKMLEDKIKQLLKLYYEFHNIDEQNAAFLAKFLLENGINRSPFEAAVFSTREGSKGLFGHIGGNGGGDGPKGDLDKWWKYVKFLPPDATFRKSKTAYLAYGIQSRATANRDSKYIKTTVQYGPQLLEKMKAIVKCFNEVSKYTRILDISFGDEPKSFVFDFLTFETKDIDGRRLSLFTEMFNAAFGPDDTLYLTYDNSDNLE